MKNQKTRFLVINALLIALMIVLQATGIGLIHLGVINVTLYCTLIAIGTQLLGLPSGLILALTFGLFSLWSAFTAPSALVAPLLSTNRLLVIALCLLPRMLVPVIINLLNKAIRKPAAASCVSAAAGSLFNTLCYLGLMLLGYAMTVADYPGLLATVGTIALTAGIPEAVLAGIIAPAVVKAVKTIYK